MSRALLSALLVGCAATTSYVYAPRDASTSHDGYPAAVIAIPKGSVELVSFGISGAGLHVRMAVQNDRDTIAWTILPADQLVAMGGRPVAAPTEGVAITVVPGDRRTLDLYYALPPGITSEDDLASFDLVWHVGGSSARTHFERFEEGKMASQIHPIFKRSEEPYWYR